MGKKQLYTILSIALVVILVPAIVLPIVLSNRNNETPLPTAMRAGRYNFTSGTINGQDTLNLTNVLRAQLNAPMLAAAETAKGQAELANFLAGVMHDRVTDPAKVGEFFQEFGQYAIAGIADMFGDQTVTELIEKDLKANLSGTQTTTSVLTTLAPTTVKDLFIGLDLAAQATALVDMNEFDTPRGVWRLVFAVEILPMWRAEAGFAAWENEWLDWRGRTTTTGMRGYWANFPAPTNPGGNTTARTAFNNSLTTNTITVTEANLDEVRGLFPNIPADQINVGDTIFNLPVIEDALLNTTTNIWFRDVVWHNGTGTPVADLADHKHIGDERPGVHPAYAEYMRWLTATGDDRKDIDMELVNSFNPRRNRHFVMNFDAMAPRPTAAHGNWTMDRVAITEINFGSANLNFADNANLYAPPVANMNELFELYSSRLFGSSVPSEVVCMFTLLEYFGRPTWATTTSTNMANALLSHPTAIGQIYEMLMDRPGDLPNNFVRNTILNAFANELGGLLNIIMDQVGINTFAEAVGTDATVAYLIAENFEKPDDAGAVTAIESALGAAFQNIEIFEAFVASLPNEVFADLVTEHYDAIFASMMPVMRAGGVYVAALSNALGLIPSIGFDISGMNIEPDVSEIVTGLSFYGMFYTITDYAGPNGQYIEIFMAENEPFADEVGNFLGMVTGSPQDLNDEVLLPAADAAILYNHAARTISIRITLDFAHLFQEVNGLGITLDVAPTVFNFVFTHVQ